MFVRVTNAGIVLEFWFVIFTISSFVLYLFPIAVVLVRTPTPSFFFRSPQLLCELSFLFENYAHSTADPVGAPSLVVRVPKTLCFAPPSNGAVFAWGIDGVAVFAVVGLFVSAVVPGAAATRTTVSTTVPDTVPGRSTMVAAAAPVASWWGWGARRGR